ncbi:MAG: hypothetical protein HC848_04485 [Limnobacter sp.]|nr:hypothetical protein [Limnobacter sp.]
MVQAIAQAFGEELLASIPRPAVHQWLQPPEAVVWFDDGEPLPRLWLEACLPELPVCRVGLPRVQGPQPWQQLLAERAGSFAINGLALPELHIAPNQHTQVQQAAEVVLRWLAENPELEIAVAVQDRLAARRLVPVLQAHQVCVDDRTGWRFSTSVVAGWFDALLAAYVQAQAIHTLRPPFDRQPLAGFQPWSVGASHTLSGWAQAYMRLFVQHGFADELAEDRAGAGLLALLRLFAADTTDHTLNAAGFKSAWAQHAESQRFRPQDVKSPVRLLPLLSLRLRRFKRVLVLGCSLKDFQQNPPGLLPAAVAQELGFPGPMLERIQKISTLHEVLQHTPQVALCHSAQSDGKPHALLPEIEWLDVLVEARSREQGVATRGCTATPSGSCMQAPSLCQNCT